MSIITVFWDNTCFKSTLTVIVMLYQSCYLYVTRVEPCTTCIFNGEGVLFYQFIMGFKPKAFSELDIFWCYPRVSVAPY